ncbi:MAG: signal peptidase II [Dehalococcoidia bacterium]|nr:signal peptidase II [Dehalococcoidia bacterium]
MQSLQTADPPRHKPPHPWTRGMLFWAAGALVVGLDQLTKALVRGSLARGEAWPDPDWPVRIRYVTNTGAAFGVLQDQTSFLILMSVIGLAAVYLYYRYPPFDHLVVPVAIGMLLGGAAGNLIDRIRLGRVTDFIDFPMWPAFNVADSSITVGAAVIILGYVFLAPGARPPPASHEDA